MGLFLPTGCKYVNSIQSVAPARYEEKNIKHTPPTGGPRLWGTIEKNMQSLRWKASHGQKTVYKLFRLKRFCHPPHMFVNDFDVGPKRTKPVPKLATTSAFWVLGTPSCEIHVIDKAQRI